MPTTCQHHSKTKAEV